MKKINKLKLGRIFDYKYKLVNADNLITVCNYCHTSENHKPGNIIHNWMIEGKKVK
ncbi:MAG: hypothetical protein U9N10_11780 [Bacillota bacterium]|nr:hypothetical protein [Bacillota bacterium]